MAVVKKISELVPKGSALGVTDLLVVGVDNGTDYDLKSVTGAQLMGASVVQTITDGDTTHSPSSNVVFDALALKVDKELGHRLITSGEATILANTSGTNTGDQDLSNLVASNTPITGATKTKITYDSKGLVTSGTDATTADIADSLNKRYVTDAEKTNINYLNTVASNVQDQINAKVNLNSPLITPATKTKISYDAKGLVLSGGDATTSDIADSLNKRYVTDANLTTIGNTSGTNTGDQDLSTLMVKSNNLSDLTNTTTARSNLGLGTLATQSGTFSGTSSGTNTGDQDLSTYQPYTTATTGSVISFVIPQVYNSVASPSSSNITDSLTSSKIGVVQKIYHNHTVAPTFPAGWVKMGTATYTTSTLNVIFAEWVSSTRVEYWITKPS